jgi:hypothetical protein
VFFWVAWSWKTILLIFVVSTVLTLGGLLRPMQLTWQGHNRTMPYNIVTVFKAKINSYIKTILPYLFVHCRVLSLTPFKYVYIIANYLASPQGMHVFHKTSCTDPMSFYSLHPPIRASGCFYKRYDIVVWQVKQPAISLPPLPFLWLPIIHQQAAVDVVLLFVSVMAGCRFVCLSCVLFVIKRVKIK